MTRKWMYQTVCVIGMIIVNACNDTTPAEYRESPVPVDSRLTGIRTWYLIENGVDSPRDTLNVQISCSRDMDNITVFLDTLAVGYARKAGDNYVFKYALDELAVGQHTLAFSASDFHSHFICTTFIRSYPLYITLTNDWEQADQPDTSLYVQEELHQRYPGLINTYFVGPYTFTDPALNDERKQHIRDWLLRMEVTYGDEIGLHLHPRCHFVELAGLKCITDSSYIPDSPEGIDPEGYTIGCNRYSEQEYLTIITCADSIFKANGLGKPTSIRAGGWTHDLDNLRALQEGDYLVDGSGANTERLRGQLSPRLEHLLTEFWGNITDLSQPYYPLLTAPSLSGNTFLLEVPNNGALVDYVTGEEMIEIIESNWSGGVLHSPRQVSIGYHSDNLFWERHISELHKALSYIHQISANDDRGPAVYLRMSDMARVW